LGGRGVAVEVYLQELSLALTREVTMKNPSCQKTVRIFASIGLCTALVLSVTSCNGSGSSPTDPAGDATGGGSNVISTSSGTLELLMIDAPTDEICELHVFIKDLRIKPNGKPQMLLGTEIGAFDLLALQDGPPAVLGSFSLAQDQYQFIEILLEESMSYVIEKEDPTNPANLNCLLTRSDLQIPSAQIKVAGGPFPVDANTTITIDFDAHKSLKKKGGNSGSNKGWQLKPDVSISNVQP
jgi:hypothetical protein